MVGLAHALQPYSGRRDFRFSQSPEDRKVHRVREEPDSLREREDVSGGHAGPDPSSSRNSREQPILPVTQLSPEVQELVRRGNAFAEFLEWLWSNKPSDGNFLEEEIFGSNVTE